MAEYIEREALKEHLMSYAGMFTGELGFVVKLDAVLRGIDFQPAADVAPVVRCKDCKHMNIVGVGYRWCKVWERIQTMGDDGYCCFGERRADNEN